MTKQELLREAMGLSDLTAKGSREELSALDLKLLEPNKKYAVFFLPLEGA